MKGVLANPAGRFLLLVAVVLIIDVPSLFTRYLWVPDEPRYAEVAREMLVSGDWIVPHCNGEIYAEKPPLFFWLSALGQVAGLGPNAGRLVTMLAVMGTFAAVYFTFRRRLGENAATLSCLVMLTSVLGMLFSKMGVIDSLLMCFEAIAIVMGYNAFHAGGRRTRLLSWLACYAATGLAILTKGPVALAVVAMVLVSYGLVNRKRVAGGGVAVHILGLAVAALVVGAWLVPAVLNGGPDYARVILFRQQVGRLLNYYGHKHPSYFYYAGIAPGYFFPWSLLWPLALVTAWLGWRRDPERNSPLLLAVLWNVVPAIFFSVLVSKRMQYLLPSLPAAGMLVAAHLTTPFEKDGRIQKTERGLLTATFALAAALMLALAGLTVVARLPVLAKFCKDEHYLALARNYATDGRVAAMLVGLAALLVIAVAGLVARPEKRVLRARLLMTMMILLSLTYDFLVVPFVDRLKSPRDICAEVIRRDKTGKSTYAYMENFSVLFNIYTGHTRIPVIKDPVELTKTLHTKGTLVIANRRDLDAIAADELKQNHVRLIRRVGDKTVYLLDGRRPNHATRAGDPKAED